MTKEQYKNKIITEVFNSREVHEKVESICYRNHINKDTLIHEDIISEVFYHLSKFNTDTLIEMYEDNPKRIIGLAVKIAIWKGVIKNKTHPDYYKHSVARNILFASNLNQFTSVHNALDEDDESHVSERLVDEAPLAFMDEDIWDVIKKVLSSGENQFLQHILTTKKGRGKYSNAFKAERDDLYNKIKDTIIKNKINVH